MRFQSFLVLEGSNTSQTLEIFSPSMRLHMTGHATATGKFLGTQGTLREIVLLMAVVHPVVQSESLVTFKSSATHFTEDIVDFWMFCGHVCLPCHWGLHVDKTGFADPWHRVVFKIRHAFFGNTNCLCISLRRNIWISL